MNPALSTLLAMACLGFVVAAPRQIQAADAPRGILLGGDLTREFRLQPGQSAEGRFVLLNASNDTTSARVYLTDYRYTADGNTTYDEPGTLPRSCAPWIEVADRQPELKAGESRSISFRVAVPREVRLSGTYWCLVMIEPLSLDEPSAPGTVRVRSIVRYGLQIVVQVGESAAAKPRIFNQSVALERGTRALCFDLSNDGERSFRPKIEVRLFDGQGRAISTLQGRTTQVLPETSVHQSFPLQNLGSGEYLAFIVLDSDDETYGAQYRFRID